MKFPSGAKEKQGFGVSFPFGHPTVKAQRDQMKGHAKALVTGKGAKVTSASGTVKGVKPSGGSKSTKPC